jgi:hypothetical protein
VRLLRERVEDVESISHVFFTGRIFPWNQTTSQANSTW